MFKKYESKPLESIQDPNTGETIHRVTIDPDLTKVLQGEFQSHGQLTQQFMMNAQAYFNILKTQFDLFGKINDKDKDVKDKMQEVMKKSGLDMKLPWAYNFALGCFERRTPPIVPGMTDAEIKAAQNVGAALNIQKNPSVGVK